MNKIGRERTRWKGEGEKTGKHQAKNLLALAAGSSPSSSIESSVQPYQTEGERVKVSVCLRLVFASCGAVSVYLVCVLNGSEGDVQLGKYADAKGRVSMCVWESSSVERTSWIPEFS